MTFQRSHGGVVTEHGEIGLRGRSLAPAGERASVTLKLSVRDTGIGIPADAVGGSRQAPGGGDGYVPKPFGRELLLAELEATLRGRRGAG
jgi:hypothetical protein